MNKFLIYFFIGFIIIGVASFFLPYAAMNFGPNGMIYAGIGFTILVLIIVFGITGLTKRSLKPKDIPNGIPATATVVSCRQGNMKVTFGGVQEIYQLIIDVTVRNQQGETWAAKMKEMIPITQIGVFQPGVSFSVKYDPKDKSRVVIDQNASAQQNNQSVNIPGYGTLHQQEIQESKQKAPHDITLRLEAASSLEQKLKISGVPATATVLAKDILMLKYIPGSDAVQLKLNVNATDRPPFEAVIVALIATTASYKVEPGKTVFVKFDRYNQQRICLTGTDKPETGIAL